MGAAFLAAEATKPIEVLGAQSGLERIEPLIGEQPAGQAPGARAPVNLRSPIDPFLEAGRTALGTIHGALGFGAEPETPPPGT